MPLSDKTVTFYIQNCVNKLNYTTTQCSCTIDMHFIIHSMQSIVNAIFMHVQTVKYHIMSNVHHMLTMTANDQIYSLFQFSSDLMCIQSVIQNITFYMHNTKYNIQCIQTLANKHISTHIIAKQQHKFIRKIHFLTSNQRQRYLNLSHNVGQCQIPVMLVTNAAVLHFLVHIS